MTLRSSHAKFQGGEHFQQRKYQVQRQKWNYCVPEAKQCGTLSDWWDEKRPGRYDQRETDQTGLVGLLQGFGIYSNNNGKYWRVWGRGAACSKVHFDKITLVSVEGTDSSGA